MTFFTEQILGEAKPTNAERLEKQREWVANLINSSEHSDFESDDSVGNISGDIVKLQENDITLTTCFEKSMKGMTIDLLAGETFLIKEGLLYRQSKEASQITCYSTPYTHSCSQYTFWKDRDWCCGSSGEEPKREQIYSSNMWLRNQILRGISVKGSHKLHLHCCIFFLMLAYRKKFLQIKPRTSWVTHCAKFISYWV